MNRYGLENLSNYNIPEELNLFRYAVVMEYNGSSFAGSQIQPGQRTVQSELENAIKILIKKEVKTIFSGRTDAGVHAHGQVAHFELSEKLDRYRFLHSLNAVLPPDISVSDIVETDREFHSQKSAVYRWYRYTINNRTQRSVWLNNAIHIHTELNLENMNKALEYIKGKHNFTSFKSSQSSNPAVDCIVYDAVCKAEDGMINIDIVANRFVYNMVRIIVGTLITIGKGIYTPEHMKSILEACDRTKAGPTAKAEGLTLKSVYYGKKYNIVNKEAYNEDILSKAS